ncbi:hypothetical protein V2I01_40895 [Micromonospora sp. BRA006-A]|nr:hypothetical protein [Micromonospora sp. BRA006-A]
MSNWVVSLAGPRHVRLEPCPTDRLGPGQVRVRTRYSGISAGTELTLYRGSNPRLRKDWDAGSRMFVPRQAAPAYPVVGFGYEEVGEIVEVAPDVAGRRPGQLVWGIWGTAPTPCSPRRPCIRCHRASTRSPPCSPGPAPSR